MNVEQAIEALQARVAELEVQAREDGAWKVAKLRFYTRYHVEFDPGWNLGGVPLAPPLPDARPDADASVRYEAFPGVFIPPYHYANPVTGRSFQGGSEE